MNLWLKYLNILENKTDLIDIIYFFHLNAIHFHTLIIFKAFLTYILLLLVFQHLLKVIDTLYFSRQHIPKQHTSVVF